MATTTIPYLGCNRCDRRFLLRAVKTGCRSGRRDNRITTDVPAAGSALQRTCDGGNLLESDETDVDLTGLETTLDGRAAPFTGYLLCATGC